ncbi:hypothetical protein ISCGN_026367 [Ixodes scapularis]
MSAPADGLRCSAKRCPISDRDKESSSSHVAPKDDKLNAIWLEAIGRSCSDKHVQVCSRHFAPEAFEIRTPLTERPRLRRGAGPDAIPTECNSSKCSIIANVVKLGDELVMLGDKLVNLVEIIIVVVKLVMLGARTPRLEEEAPSSKPEERVEGTAEYRDELMDEVMTCLEKWLTLREAREANPSQHLPPICARYPKPPKSDLIAARRLRFSSHAGEGACCPWVGFGVLRAAARSSSNTWVALDSIRGAGPRRATSAYEPCARNDQRFLASRTPVYGKRGPKWCIASPEGPRRVQTYPGFDSTTRMPFSPDTGKPRTARRGRANPHGSGSVETPLSKHLLSQVPPAGFFAMQCR